MKPQKAIFTSKVIGVLRTFLQEYYPLASILIGYFLVAITIGPYQNGDTAWEYDAVLGVIKTGLPVANGGYLMDQPPLGFYIHALFFQAFGMSIDNGTLIVTLFGLGSTALVYGIGRLLYNKSTGFFAALLFAFSPWHLILSRSFLIDAPCLFFSLLSLFIALFAFRKNSLSLFALSGIAFAAAFNTKLYAIFVLIPLTAFFIQHRPKNVRQITIWLVAFSIPTIITVLLWYQLITGIGLSSIFLHADLTTENQIMLNPTPFFAINFLASYGLGWFFIDATIAAVLIGLWQRRALHDFLFSDIICLTTIICVLSVNVILGAFLGLKAPFLNAIKYDYQALPFFSILAASLVSKSSIILKNPKHRASLITISVLGLVLVAAAFLYNMWYTNLFSTWSYLIFRVDPQINQGYSLFNFAAGLSGTLWMALQLLGYIIAISGTIWITRKVLYQGVKEILGFLGHRKKFRA